MEDNELIHMLKNLVTIIDSNSQAWKDMRNETMMWRNRFLDSLPKYESKEKGAYIYCSILAIPSSDFSKFSPEEIVKKSIDFYENK